ncbi:MAG: TRAP transporter large permease subunit [bacterium]|nr:TRAP transporter large permease subunit [bacterium]
MLATILIVFFMILMFTGLPLFIFMGGMSLILFYFIADVSSAAIFTEAYRLASAPAVIAIPLFTFAGFLLAESKAPIRMVNLSRAFLGWLPGGLSIVGLVTCAVFTALTGASGVTIIAVGAILYNAMQDDNYPDKFSMGLITTSGSLGLLFPPSLPIIIYGMVSSSSVDKLFVAGLLPGILLVVLLSIYSIFSTARQKKIVREKITLPIMWSSLVDCAWEIPVPIIILGGIYGGIFTASEAAAVTTFYVAVVEIFIKRDIKLKQLGRLMKESMILIGGILIILCTAMGFTNFLVDQQVPMKLFAVIKTHITSHLTFLLALNGFLLIVGCLMDIFSALIIVVPIILPIAHFYGVDPIHLGIIFLLNLEIGYSTPPVGVNLFISSFRFKKSIPYLWGSVWPFLIIYVITLLIVTYIPSLSLILLKYSKVQ